MIRSIELEHIQDHIQRYLERIHKIQELLDKPSEADLDRAILNLADIEHTSNRISDLVSDYKRRLNANV